MNQETGIVWTTRVVAISFFVILIWLFVLMVTGMFDLKVAGKHLTNGFVFGLPLLLGAVGAGLVLNVVLNLNKIGHHQALRAAAAQGDAAASSAAHPLPWRWALGTLALLSAIVLLLFGGDHYTQREKERFLLADAQASVAAFESSLGALAGLPWGPQLVKDSGDLLSLMGKQNKNFPHVTLLVQERLLGKAVVLELGGYRGESPEKMASDETSKISFVRALTPSERDYLDAVFARGQAAHRYSADDGEYELFYPVKLGGQRQAALYFSQRMRYGKSGS